MSLLDLTRPAREHNLNPKVPIRTADNKFCDLLLSFGDDIAYLIAHVPYIIDVFCIIISLSNIWFDTTYSILTLKTPAKIIWKFHLHLSSAANFCERYLTKLSIETNSVDPDQTAPIGAVWSECTLFVGKASKTKQTAKPDKFCCNWLFKG